VEDLRLFALSRIFLDNFPHIKAYWVTAGINVAQLALHFGADDIDGTIKREMIMHAAGSLEKEGLTVDEVVKVIKEAGLVPVERDTFYRPLRSYAA
jgi:aminodeoxyfutalosine synthase